jgi:predicted RNase H-like nuclease (RuvC/YqgF family)
MASFKIKNFKIKNILKSKKVWVTVGLIVAYSVGVNSAEIDLEGKKVDYAQITQKIDTANQELKKKQEALKAEDNRLNQRKEEVDQILSLLDKQDELNKEIDTKAKELDTKKTELNKLNSDIKAKQSELEQLTNVVKKKQEEPKTLPAGEFIVGKDIPEGRYKAVPVGRGSNFVVYSASGALKVNTILGNHSGLGSPEYVFFAKSGDIIKNEAPAKLIPVE